LFFTAGEIMKTNELKNNIRRLRFEKGEMTQQQLADLAGVTRQTIIAMEQGKYAPSLPLAFKIARAFGVGIDQVFEYTETIPPETA
jgi:putative transcriptional regulator